MTRFVCGEGSIGLFRRCSTVAYYVQRSCPQPALVLLAFQCFSPGPDLLSVPRNGLHPVFLVFHLLGEWGGGRP